MSGCCLNFTRGILEELGAEDVANTSTPLVPSIATQLLARHEAVSLNATVAPPMRERYGNYSKSIEIIRDFTGECLKEQN
jgi:hypothetical protein